MGGRGAQRLALELESFEQVHGKATGDHAVVVAGMMEVQQSRLQGILARFQSDLQVRCCPWLADSGHWDSRTLIAHRL